MNSKNLGERIARQVVRAFYDQVSVVVFDGLLMEPMSHVNDCDLALHLGLSAKLVRTTLQALKRDGFVQEQSQHQAANSKKATIFLWSFSVERFARIFRYRMLMVRKQATALANQAIADETFICSSALCFFHTQSLSTIEAIESCKRLGTTDFICEHCRSPLTKESHDAADAIRNNEDLKQRLNQQLSAIENQVSQLVQLIAQERIETASQTESLPFPTARMTSLTSQEEFKVHIESTDAALQARTAAVLSAGGATTGPAQRPSATPWDLPDDTVVADDTQDTVDTVDINIFEKMLKRQEQELTMSKTKVEPVTTDITLEGDVDHHHATMMIRGKSVMLSSITDEMAQAMSNEEYAAYERLLTATGAYEIDYEFDI